MIGPDRFIRCRPYLDVILRPLPVWVTTGSAGILLNLQCRYGKDIDHELTMYFAVMGDNGQRDPFNQWRKPCSD